MSLVNRLVMGGVLVVASVLVVGLLVKFRQPTATCLIGNTPTLREGGRGHLNEVTYGGGLFVASDGAGGVYTSADGLAWQYQVDLGFPPTGIAYGNGRFVLTSACNLVATSPDGRRWRKLDPKVGSLFTGLVYGKGEFLTYSRKAIHTSKDGVTWESHGINHPGYGRIAFGSDQYVGITNVMGPAISTSPDGLNWSMQERTASDQWGVVYGGGRYVIVGDKGLILTSEQGSKWEEVKAGTKQWLSAVAFGNGRFVAVGHGGTILTSPDGRTWQIAQQEGEGVDHPWIWSVTYGDGRFVAVGDNLTAWVSSDGMTWRTVQLQPQK